VVGPDPAAIGDLALRHGIGLHELRPVRSSLEDVYTRLTSASVDHRTRAARRIDPLTTDTEEAR
jgi:ABC-2 type transport system ATP-binding protein